MKFAFKFSNLLGTVYKKGNLSFTNDGDSVISPVGNRISIFDLKNNKSETLPVESGMNITAVALSPDGNLIIAVNEEGEASLISLLSRTVLRTYHFHRPVHCVKFSPDGKKFAVTKENNVLLFHAPGQAKEVNPFVLERTFYGAYDETVCIDWTTDSKAFCVGGKDMNTRIFGAERFANLIIYSVGGHNGPIVGAFFEHNSLDLYTLSDNGQLVVWECDTDLDGLVPYDPTKKQKEEEEEDEEIDEEEKKKKDKQIMAKDAENAEGKILFKRAGRFNYKNARGEKTPFAKLTSTDYHKTSKILVTGFQDGCFFLHEMPDFVLIHSLSISDQVIASVAFNKTGDWLALGCSGLGQLLVWEWQSETYILKQQGHFNNMSSLYYSPDGQFIVTGGDDGKVKVWNTSSGFCFVTFTEHIGGITGVVFSHNGKIVVSSSLDGTVRAFDLHRYRNFRTFTSPRPAQFSSLALDHSDEIVCAGALDTFEIFVWSMKTGRLLDVLAGHEGPISSLAFSPIQSMLASGSWDKTVKLWDVFENKGSKETLQVTSDVVALTFRPDGKEVAIATLNAQIAIWDVVAVSQTGTIEGRHDMGYTRKEAEKITAKQAAFGKSFNTLCYTADGMCLLAAGRSKNVCIYSVADKMLMKKFEITCNRSFDGTQEFLDRRKMTEWGSLSLVDDGQGDELGTPISLPGVKKGDMSSRHWKPEVRVLNVQFSPTGRAWAATSTEGLLIYSLDHNLVFDPFELDIEITPENVRRTLKAGEFSHALMLAFRLNEQALIMEVSENIPVSNVEFVSQSLPDKYVDKMLAFVATQLENSRHLNFYLIWCQHLLMHHGNKLKQRSQSIMATIRNLQKNLTRKHEDLSKVCDHNKYSIQYIVSMAHTQKKRPLPKSLEDELSDDEEEDTDQSDDEKESVISQSDSSSVAESMES